MFFRRQMLALLRRRNDTDWNSNEDFFRYTRGRFVSRETEQMAQRHVKFNMNELCEAAGKAVGKQCISVEKFADGLYNKAFLLTMDDNDQVVAKVPNPNAGVPHLTTASEVATMDMIRNIVGTPAPRVIAWDSRAENAVNAEYIIMEKAKGVQLGSVWPTMDIDQKGQVIRAIARHLRSWSKISFSHIGSLYYRKDLPAVDETTSIYIDGLEKPIQNTKFAIGPITGREWSDSGKPSVRCDRGPWTSADRYRRAIIERDQKAIQELPALPRPLSMLCGPTLYQPTREKKLFACETVLKSLHHILPQKRWARSFHMWHNDLHGENIFVDADDPTVILTIIDWQSTFIAPLFDHVMTPVFLNYDGPAVQGMERPTPPKFPEDIDEDAKAIIGRLYENQVLASAYKHLLKRNIEPIFDAIMYEESTASAVLTASRNLFETGEALCLGSIAALEDSPVQFSGPILADIEKDAERTLDSMNAMMVIKEALGSLFPEKGIVRPERY
ncbi:phosphotransferase enzyme family protein [Pseudovirgaria hyperparasitica]|uniref:Altered inheritance of mitochondria protein 9, mitochondrial n=1 Tax=Pseudovirgaria hyperparasitica TaxID=470096 RepID=A0A6A6VU13_9PEZI|nr:phosphotransferase enzyme family protein [Pseudovirgaria hyperparasitica]KAF2753100.1 phosphotransferase enzyme family protein [Pseudovirgaria hyperparasitica]